MPTLFPQQFADLEGIGAQWSLQSNHDRYTKRLNSSMQEMEKFYSSVLPRIGEIMRYCDRFEVSDPPEDVRALMNMLYSLVAVSFAVEVWKQPRVPNTGTTYLKAFIEPAV